MKSSLDMLKKRLLLCVRNIMTLLEDIILLSNALLLLIFMKFDRSLISQYTPTSIEIRIELIAATPRAIKIRPLLWPRFFSLLSWRRSNVLQFGAKTSSSAGSIMLEFTCWNQILFCLHSPLLRGRGIRRSIFLAREAERSESIGLIATKRRQRRKLADFNVMLRVKIYHSYWNSTSLIRFATWF